MVRRRFRIHSRWLEIGLRVNGHMNYLSRVYARSPTTRRIPEVRRGRSPIRGFKGCLRVFCAEMVCSYLSAVASIDCCSVNLVCTVASTFGAVTSVGIGIGNRRNVKNYPLN